MSALVRRLGSSLRYSLGSSIGGGGRLPHAPAPTRYRFAIQGADRTAGLLKVNTPLDAGAHWTTSAWASSTSAWATLTTDAVGNNLNGGAREDALLRALWDIRRFAERVDKHSCKHSSDLKNVTLLIKALKVPSSTWKRSLFVLIAAAVIAIFYLSYQKLTQWATRAKLEQLLVEMLNNVATDPESEDTIRMYLLMFVDLINTTFNPMEKVKSVFMSNEEENPMFGTLVKEEIALSLKILYTLRLVHGPTFDGLVKDLNLVGTATPTKVKEMIDFLQEIGYIEVMETQRNTKTYWPSKEALQDSDSGAIEIKTKTWVKAKVKADLKTKGADA